jgi:hypothetical protein
MINFCTLFDSNYLTRGLALYESLVKVCPSFHLYVVTFDQASYDYLSTNKPSFLTPISLQDFEDSALVQVKSTRSPAEYCWTCTPSVILYCIETFNLDACTYLDADMLFFHNPEILFEEDREASIVITSHNYSRIYDQSAISGTYCVQFMYFRNDTKAMKALRWWRERCLEWCYAYVEDGKFGDQKYLEDWPTRFEAVHVLNQPGAGLAPWNLQQYTFYYSGKQLTLKEKLSGNSFPVVFFHFHGLKFHTDNKVSFTGSLYELDDQAKDIFYIPYTKELLRISNTISGVHKNIKSNGANTESPSRKSVLLNFIRERLILLKRKKLSPLQGRNYNFARHYHYYELDNLQ